MCPSLPPPSLGVLLQALGADSVRGQGEVLALQASLFQAQLELQADERVQRQAVRAQDDLSRALQRLETDLQGALQHRRETQRHNQVRILHLYHLTDSLSNIHFNTKPIHEVQCTRTLHMLTAGDWEQTIDPLSGRHPFTP